MPAGGTMMEMAPKLSELQKPHTDLKLKASAAVQWCIAEYKSVQLSERQGEKVFGDWVLCTCVKIRAIVTMLYIQYKYVVIVCNLLMFINAECGLFKNKNKLWGISSLPMIGSCDWDTCRSFYCNMTEKWKHWPSLSVYNLKNPNFLDIMCL